MAIAPKVSASCGHNSTTGTTRHHKHRHSGATRFHKALPGRARHRVVHQHPTALRRHRERRHNGVSSVPQRSWWVGSPHQFPHPFRPGPRNLTPEFARISKKTARHTPIPDKSMQFDPRVCPDTWLKITLVDEVSIILHCRDWAMQNLGEL